MRREGREEKGGKRKEDEGGEVREKNEEMRKEEKLIGGKREGRVGE